MTRSQFRAWLAHYLSKNPTFTQVDIQAIHEKLREIGERK